MSKQHDGDCCDGCIADGEYFGVPYYEDKCCCFAKEEL